MKMTKGKSFWLGVLFTIVVMMIVNALWGNFTDRREFKVEEVFPNEEAIQSYFLDKHPIGKPVSNIMVSLETHGFKFKGNPMEGINFDLKSPESCCAFVYSKDWRAFLSMDYRSIGIVVEFDNNLRITDIYVNAYTAKLYEFRI